MSKPSSYALRCKLERIRDMADQAIKADSYPTQSPGAGALRRTLANIEDEAKVPSWPASAS